MLNCKKNASNVRETSYLLVNTRLKVDLKKTFMCDSCHVGCNVTSCFPSSGHIYTEDYHCQLLLTVTFCRAVEIS